MAIETINLGTYANDGQGDDLRSAFQKVNSNFSQLNNIVATNGLNLGDGAEIFAGKGTSDPDIGDVLRFRTVKAGTNITLTSDSTSITIAAINSIASVSQDLTPSLGGNLNLNSKNITGSGNINSTGNITVSGVISASSFVGNLSGNSTSVTNGVYTVGNQIIDGEKTFLHSIVGNLSGNADTVTNGVYTTSSINALVDVDTTTQTPITGQALVWAAGKWSPQDITVGIPQGFDFGGFANPANMLELLIQATAIEFGTITSPSSANLDMGSII